MIIKMRTNTPSIKTYWGDTGTQCSVSSFTNNIMPGEIIILTTNIILLLPFMDITKYSRRVVGLLISIKKYIYSNYN